MNLNKSYSFLHQHDIPCSPPLRTQRGAQMMNFAAVALAAAAAAVAAAAAAVAAVENL